MKTQAFLPVALFLAHACAGAAGIGPLGDPTPDEVWQLLRETSALYESLDALDYDVVFRAPEIEALLAAKTGGLVGRPELRISRHELTNKLTFSFPDLPGPFRAAAENRAQKEVEHIDALRILRELGWTIFGAFTKSIDAGGSYDIIEWNDATAVVEFNNLSEHFLGRVMHVCRIRFDRRRSTLDGMLAWFGGAETLDFALDYDPREFFTGTRVPLVKSLAMHQHGFQGPPTATLIAGAGKYTRSVAALADDASTSWRAQLKRAGLSRYQVDEAKIDADGGLRLNFNGSAMTTLPSLAGLLVKGLDLTGTKIADLRPLAGLPLRSLILDDTPVTDLAPLAGLPLEELSLRNVRATDFAILKNVPLKKLSVAGSAEPFDLLQLAGMKLEELDLQQRPVADLTPLRGMPLRELNLDRTQVTDLEALRGMPLTRLSLRWTAIHDVAPLAECRGLVSLALSGTPLEDLRPLSGLPLVHLDIGRGRVRDLAPLRGMPLRSLSADNTNILDIAPLLECRELEDATIPFVATNIPLLQKHPALKALSFRWDSGRDGAAQSAAEFWTEWALPASAQRRAGSAMVRQNIEAAGRAGGYSGNVAEFEDGAISVNLNGQPVSDLAPLSGLPITILLLEGTKVRDLAPLRGMPLRRLSLSRTDVADLSPLRGMPLTELVLHGCPVSDLSPLAGMPLTELGLGVRSLEDVPRIGTQVANLEPLRGMPFRSAVLDGTINPDLAPLLDCPQLEEIIMPPKYRNLDALRTHPKLATIIWDPPSGARKTQPVAEFWKERDAQK